MDVVELGNENRCHHFVKGGSVHVDVGPDGQHEASDSFVDLESLLTTLESERQRGRAWRNTTPPLLVHYSYENI